MGKENKSMEVENKSMEVENNEMKLTCVVSFAKTDTGIWNGKNYEIIHTTVTLSDESADAPVKQQLVLILIGDHTQEYIIGKKYLVTALPSN